MIEIGYERRDRIAYITLNRPEAKNAITPEMHEELCRIWADFRDADDADVAILTGTGDAFCAGADLASYVPVNYVDASPSRVREIVDLGFGGITRGAAPDHQADGCRGERMGVAGGLEALRLLAHLRVASQRAMFGSFEARRGFHHGDGGITRLVNTCGVGVAMQMVLTAEPISAQAGSAMQHGDESCSPRNKFSKRRNCWPDRFFATPSERCDPPRRLCSRSSASRWTISCGSRAGIHTAASIRPRRGSYWRSSSISPILAVQARSRPTSSRVNTFGIVSTAHRRRIEESRHDRTDR